LIWFHRKLKNKINITNINNFIIFVTLFVFRNFIKLKSKMEIKASKKKNILMQTAKDLFWKHGFKKISVEEICVKAKVSKMSFYRFFNNKTELAKQILDAVITESYLHFKDIMNQKNCVADKMQQIVMMKKEGTKDISMEFLSDLYSNPHSELKDYMTARTQEVWRLLAEDFKKAQKEGWLRSDFKPEFLLAISFKMADLLNDKQLSSMYDTPQELIMEMTNLIAYGISER